MCDSESLDYYEEQHWHLLTDNIDTEFAEINNKHWQGIGLLCLLIIIQPTTSSFTDSSNFVTFS